jgi:hypothetical protein
MVLDFKASYRAGLDANQFVDKPFLRLALLGAAERKCPPCAVSDPHAGVLPAVHLRGSWPNPAFPHNRAARLVPFGAE